MIKRNLLLCSAILVLSGCSGNPSVPDIILHTEGTTIIEETTTSEISTSAENNTDITDSSAVIVIDSTTEATTSEEAESDTTEADTTAEAEPESSAEPTAEATTEVPEPVRMYTTASVNVRQEPSVNSEKIDLYAEGAEVLVYSVENGWAMIRVGDKTCYISADYLTTSAPAPETTTEVPPTEQTTVAPTEAPTVPPTEPDTTAVTPPSGITVTAVSYCGVLYKQGDGPTVCIDPGHMGKGDSRQEPSAPGSAETKARATTGTEGCVTHIHESVVNLQTSLQLKDVLLSRGYNVMMTRESEDVNISNMERALMASNDGADILVRVHCNSVVDQNVSGIVTMAPSSGNPYVAHLYNQCYSLSDKILNSMVATTGAVNKGILLTDTMSGINWSSIPVTIVEMGFMSNPTEDQLLCDASYQAKLVQGMANGIDAYFGR